MTTQEMTKQEMIMNLREKREEKKKRRNDNEQQHNGARGTGCNEPLQLLRLWQ